MTIDIQEPGSAMLVRHRVRAPRPPGAFATIARMLGLVPRLIERVDEVAFPYAFAVVDGSVAEDALAHLLRRHPDCTPVILGAPADAAWGLLEGRSPAFRDEAGFELGLTSLEHFDLDRWIAERMSGDYAAPRGPWPTERKRVEDPGLHSIYKTSRKARREFESEVVVAAIPTADPTLLALRLGYGDWNECPAPVAHAAFARRWRDAHGATPAVFAADVVEYRIARPISTREQALVVAAEHYAYCPDIVLQGTQTLEGLAAELVGSRYWFFWWD